MPKTKEKSGPKGSKAGGKSVNVIPVGARVLVEPEEEKKQKDKTESGIYIPESNSSEKPERGKVIAVGEGEYQDGKLIPLKVKVGDKVIFSKYGYDEIKVDEKKYFVIKEENILAVIK